MRFKSHTVVDGDNIKGNIIGGVFVLTHINARKQNFPPLNTERKFTEKELENLISEFEQIRDQIVTDTVSQAN